MPRPEYLEPVHDPAFGTVLTRVTEPGQQIVEGVSCRPDYCRHRYSSAQAWNADQSLLLIAGGCSGMCFLHGQTYQPLFHRASSHQCEWHPVDPERMICMHDQEIYIWFPRSNTTKRVFAPQGYSNFQFGPAKGNLSQDGNRLAVRARDATGALVVFAYDLSTNEKYPDIALAELPGESTYCSISPTGRYIFCNQRMNDETNQAYIYSVDGTRVQSWEENHRPGHGDMTIDVDGQDVYVGTSKAGPDRNHIIKRRLSDGFITVLAPAGDSQHISTRNINRPGWAFVTYGTDSRNTSKPGWVPYHQEIVALRIDGSGEVRRIVHTRSAKHDYHSQAQASPSPDGSQIIWSSNWGEAGGPVASYVARLTWE